MKNHSERIAKLSPEQLAALSMWMKKRGVAAAKPQLITRRRATDPSPLSFAQQRLWFLDKLVPNSPLYNIPAALRMTGPLNVEALESSLHEIVRRHEALRTTFRMRDSQPEQVIAPSLHLALPVYDLTGFAADAQQAEVERMIKLAAQTPFDLMRGPLLRVGLMKLQPQEHVLLLTTHHIVSDNWSHGILIKELAALYEAHSSVRVPPLPELPIQYSDYAFWQRGWLQGEVLEAQLSYWRRRLAGVPILRLPTDRPRPPVQSFRGAAGSYQLPARLSARLRELSRREGVTLFMTLLTAFNVLLYRYTGQDDVVIGSPIANRNRAEIEGLIGFFVNMLVLRSDLSGNPTFRELLGRVRAETLGAYGHQDVPFEKLVEELKCGRDMSRMPLFQVVFALQNAPTQPSGLSGLTISPLQVDTGTAMFDFVLGMVETEPALSGAFLYNTDLFDGATITRMLDHFTAILETAVADPDGHIIDIPLRGIAENEAPEYVPDYQTDEIEKFSFQ